MKKSLPISPYLLLTLAKLFWAGHWVVSRALRRELLQGRRLHGREATGILVSFIGVIAVVPHGDWQRLRDLTLNRGDLWILASVVTWPAYTLLLSRLPAMHPLAFLAAISVTGLVFLLPFYLWEMAQGRHVMATPGAIAGIWLNTRRRP